MMLSSLGLFRQRKYLKSLLSSDLLDDAFILWGKKHPKRRLFAQKILKKPIIYLEDGFLRSMGLGVEGEAPLSLVMDDVGIYYDAMNPSKLERLIRDKNLLHSKSNEAQKALNLVLKYGLSKYNRNLDSWPDSLSVDESCQNILLVDQTVGDLALQYGGASKETFLEMFKVARAENPEAVLWIKVHPDVLSGKKQGCLTDILQNDQVKIISENLNPSVLLKKMDQVYTVTSQFGFEALIRNKRVVTFGLPWYAGWGITDDRHEGILPLKQLERRTEATLLELFTAAYLCYSCYINPFSGKEGSIFDVIDYLHQNKQHETLLEGEIWITGLSWWKKKTISPFLETPSNRLKFFNSVTDFDSEKLTKDTKILVWGRKQEDAERWAAQYRVPVLAMEDGFIRSVGLGSNLASPLSLVIDNKGIYFDARTVSRLESLLQETIFNQREIEAAQLLIKQLNELNIGKYNVGIGGMPLPEPRPEKVILVPGQVEDDASIRYGSPEIQSNLILLETVRQRNPDAYIVFKPHPDVVSGNRVGMVSEEAALSFADQIVSEADILSCIHQVDEVHTMTSLAGFEALLRGKKVVCYGLPFYAGWGLTEDMVPLSRRTRRLTIYELVVGCMMRYPVYLHPNTGKLVDAFAIVDVLNKQKTKRTGKIHSSWLGRRAMQLKALLIMAAKGK